MVTLTLQVYLPYHGPAVRSTACCPQTLWVRNISIVSDFNSKLSFQMCLFSGWTGLFFWYHLDLWAVCSTGCAVWLDWESAQEPIYWLNLRWVPIAPLNPKFGFTPVKIKFQSLPSTDLDLLFSLSYRYINESCARVSEQNLPMQSNTVILKSLKSQWWNETAFSAFIL